MRARLSSLNDLARSGRSRDLFESVEFKAIIAFLRECDPRLWPIIREFVAREAANNLVRAVLLYQLAELQDRDCIPLLLHYLEDPDAFLRRYVSLGFRAFGDPSFATILLDRIRVETDRGVRDTLLTSAIELHSPHTSRVLWTMFREETDYALRGRIIEALVRDPGSHSIQEVIDLLLNEQDPQVAARGLNAIANLKTQDAVSILVAIASTNPASQQADIAIRRLAEIGDPHAAEELVRLLKGAETVEAQRNILSALWRAPLNRDLEYVVWGFALQKTDAELREYALRVLQRGTSPDVSRLLAAVASDGSEPLSVRSAAVDALANRGGVTSRDTLRQLVLPGHPPELRQKAIVGLVLQGDVESALVIRGFALRDTSPEIRRTSVHVLGEVGYIVGPDAVQDVIDKALTDSNPEIRKTAEYAKQRAAGYRPENLRQVLRERFGDTADVETLEREILEGKQALLDGLTR